MSESPAICQKPMHKACRCIRPAGHEGHCNCTYPSGVSSGDTRSLWERVAEVVSDGS